MSVRITTASFVPESFFRRFLFSIRCALMLSLSGDFLSFSIAAMIYSRVMVVSRSRLGSSGLRLSFQHRCYGDYV